MAATTPRQQLEEKIYHIMLKSIYDDELYTTIWRSVLSDLADFIEGIAA